MISVAKFFENPAKEQQPAIPFISRTFCKLAFISKDYKGPMPKDSEFWWVQIVQETFAKGRAGQSGCFVVEPIRKVRPDEKIMRLIPGMFSYEVTEGILLIRPLRNVGLPWIFPLNLRKKLAKKYEAHAVIVDLTPDEDTKSSFANGNVPWPTAETHMSPEELDKMDRVMEPVKTAPTQPTPSKT